MSFAEIQKWFGSDVTARAIGHFVQEQLRPHVKKLVTMVEAGGDPKDVPLELGWASKKTKSQTFRSPLFLAPQPSSFPIAPAGNSMHIKSEVVLMMYLEIARFYGRDATPSAVQNIFARNIRPDVKKVTAVVNSGGDASDLAFTEFSFATTKNSNGQIFWSLNILCTTPPPPKMAFAREILSRVLMITQKLHCALVAILLLGDSKLTLGAT